MIKAKDLINVELFREDMKKIGYSDKEIEDTILKLSNSLIVIARKNGKTKTLCDFFKRYGVSSK